MIEHLIASGKAAFGLPFCVGARRLVAAIAVVLLTALGGQGHGAELEFTIAVAAPALGAAGPRPDLGREVFGAARLAAEDLNAHGGVAGRKVIIAEFDDGCSSAGGAAVAQKIVAAAPAAVIGHPCSNAATAAAAVYAKAGLLFIAAGATHPRVTSPRPGKQTFRIPAADSAVGRFVGEALAALPADARIAVLSDRTSLARSNVQDMLAALRHAGRTPGLVDTFAGGQKDFSRLATRLKDAAITHLGLASFPDEGALLIVEARREVPGLVILATEIMNDPDVARIAGAAVEGVQIATQVNFNGRPATDALAIRFSAAKITARRTAFSAYAAVEAYAAALQRAPSADAAAISAALSAQGAQTVLGDIRFDARGDAILPVWEISHWHSGVLQPKDRP